MTIKEMRCVQDAIRHAKDAISELGCENYPYTPIQDEDLRKMFYALNDMCITISEKIHDAEEETQ